MTSNRERIEQWRARREAGLAARAVHGDLPTDFALLATQGAALTSGGSIDAEPMLDVVLGALRGLPSESSGDRRQIYDALARGFEHGIETAGADPDYAELRRRQLRAIIRLIEDDVRAGTSAVAIGYRPRGLEDAITPLVAGYRRRRERSEAERISFARRQAVLANEAFTIAIPPEEEGDLIYLRELIALMDAERGGREPHQASLTWRAVKNLVIYQFNLLKAESRLALVWTMIGPAVLMALISTGYLLTGTHMILNMDVPTFSMIGATTWIMFRNVIFRSSASFHAHRWLLNIRPFNPLLVGITSGLMYIGAFGVVFLVLITVGNIVGIFTLPDNIPAVMFWIACVGVAALAMGVIFGSIAVVWHYFLRFAPVIERALQVVSSVFFVTEQLPSEYRTYFLLSPFAHAMQLLRSAYFVGYKSDDANAEYFFVSLGCLLVAALVIQKSVRWRSVPM